MYIFIVIYLKVGFAIECGGECHVVERSNGCAGSAVGRHTRHAVLSLVGRQFAPQLVRGDVGLPKIHAYNIILIITLQGKGLFS